MNIKYLVNVLFLITCLITSSAGFSAESEILPGELSPKLSAVKTARATQCQSDFCRYIDYSGGKFINFTSKCRWAVFVVTSGSDYYEIWHHRAESFEPFGWPPYKDSSTSVTRRSLTSLSCDSNPPGINY